jgi:uncharacterized protein YPO0396
VRAPKPNTESFWKSDLSLTNVAIKSNVSASAEEVREEVEKIEERIRIVNTTLNALNLMTVRPTARGTRKNIAECRVPKSSTPVEELMRTRVEPINPAHHIDLSTSSEGGFE